jgi:SSS family solute:Na+ symporter
MKTSKDFLEASRSLPAWTCGLAFLGAGLGAPEVIGMGAWGARYGLQSALLVSTGVICAMVFLALFMMPLYYGPGYGSRARTVPEFLGLRFDGRSRTLAACLVAVLTIAASGLSLYAVARLMEALHVFDGIFRAAGWEPSAVFGVTIFLAALVVLASILLGGLRGAIYNHVFQFLLLVAGFLPLVVLGLRKIGGWNGLKAAAQASLLPSTGAIWPGAAGTGAPSLQFILLGLGLGLALGAGFWATDFRVLQIALAAKNLDSARRVPLIGAIPKLFLPFLLVLPGLVAIGLPTPRTTTVERILDGAIVRTTTVVRPEVEAGNGLVPAKTDPATGQPLLDAAGQPQLDYGMATPALLVRLLPTGLLGLGLAALLASLMSGMAASATAFNAVFTYDLYQPFFRKDTSPGASLATNKSTSQRTNKGTSKEISKAASPDTQTDAGDTHLLAVGRWATVGCIPLSVGVACAAAQLNHQGLSILSALAFFFALANAPLLATLLLAMFSRRATGHGAFAGLLAGVAAALLHHGLTLPVAALPGFHGGWFAVLHRYPSPMAQCLGTGAVAFAANLIVTLLVSYLTEARPESELAGLVHSLTPKPKRAQAVWWKRPETLAAAILLAAVALNFLFV